MGFVRWMITKMATKMAAYEQFALVGTLTVIYHPISSKYHAWITFIKLSHKFEYKFCPMNNKKMATKMAPTCQFARVDTLAWSFITQFFQISYMDYFHQTNFHVWIWVFSDEW